MSFIKKRIINGTTYIYEITSYRNENGKVKTKDKILGKLDENGNLIPSKRRLASSTPKEDINNKVPAIPLPAIPEVIEAPPDHLTESPDNLATGEARNSDNKSESEPCVNSSVPTTNEDKSLTSEIVPLISEPPSQDLPQVTSKKAEQYRMGNTKVENTIFDEEKNKLIYDEPDIEKVKINVSKRNSQQKRIDTLLFIDFNDSKKNGITISYEDHITPYDREIHNAVATLSAAGNEYITPGMIFQLLSGNISDEKNKVSEESREKILRSIEKMRFTNIKINATAEVRAGMIAQAIYDGYLIPAEIVEVIMNGQRIKECIHLLRTLPLFDYANHKKQVISIEVKLLDTPLINTPENIELKSYMLRRILSIKNTKNNMSDTIRYETIYKYLKIKAPNSNALKVKQKQIRDKVKKLLDYWKSEEFIRDYKEEKEGRSFAKITIYCNKLIERWKRLSGKPNSTKN